MKPVRFIVPVALLFMSLTTQAQDSTRQSGYYESGRQLNLPRYPLPVTNRAGALLAQSPDPAIQHWYGRYRRERKIRQGLARVTAVAATVSFVTLAISVPFLIDATYQQTPLTWEKPVLWTGFGAFAVQMVGGTAYGIAALRTQRFLRRTIQTHNQKSSINWTLSPNWAPSGAPSMQLVGTF
jgi:hypothetical protein